MAAITSGGTDAIFAVAAALVGAAVIVGWGFVVKLAFAYHVEVSRLRVRLLGLTVGTVCISDIEFFEIVPFASIIPFSRTFRWDLFISHKWCGYSKRVVAIRTRTGLIKRIIISPDDPERLVSLLSQASGING